jgi:hypothetical protein
LNDSGSRTSSSVPTWHSRITGYSWAGVRPAAARVSRNRVLSLPTLSSLTIGEGNQASLSLAARFTATSTVARHPDRRATLLLRLEARRHAGHGVEAAAMLDLVVAPQLADQLDALDEARHALLERHADRGRTLLCGSRGRGPMIALPPVSQSSVAVSSATTTGLSSGSSSRPGPEPHALGFGGEARQQRHRLEHL